MKMNAAVYLKLRENLRKTRALLMYNYMMMEYQAKEDIDDRGTQVFREDEMFQEAMDEMRRHGAAVLEYPKDIQIMYLQARRGDYLSVSDAFDWSDNTKPSVLLSTLR